MLKRSIFSLLLLTLALAGCRSRAAEMGAPRDLVIRVGQSGVYILNAKDVKPFGWDMSKLDAEKIHLMQGEREIPMAISDKGGLKLRFYGHVAPTRFDNQVAYVLRYEDAKPARIQSRSVASLGIEPARTFSDTVTLETNSVYLAQVREGDPWLGERFFAPAELAMTVETPELAGGAASLTVTMWAASESKEDIDHHMIVTLNEQKLGEEWWDGKGVHVFKMTIPPGVLKERNKLILSSPGDTGAPADLIYLDKVRISYQRKLLLKADQLAFTSDQQALSIENRTGKQASVWDITAPEQPVALDGVTQSKGAMAFQEAGALQRRYIVFTNASRKPDSIDLAPPPLTPPKDGADYIVIVHPSLAKAIQPLVDYRRDQGLRVAVARTDQIYLKFGAGMQSPAAITDFLRWAVETWPKPAPRFLLLAGDASYDPLNYLDAPYKNLIPSAFVSTIEMGETASDNAMADLDGDGWQDLAVGRFPAQTPEDIQAMVQKTIAFETSRPKGDWINRMLFVADDDDANFNAFNKNHIAMLPPQISAENLTITPDEDVRGELLAKLNEGRGLVSYMGHGALDIWAQEEIFTAKDVPELRQEGRLGVFLVWACLNGYFQHPNRISLGETLLVTPKKGAVAGLFPTGQTFPNDQWVMADALFGQALFAQKTIGEAFMKAAHALSPESPGQRDIINTFLLLGDPALRLPWKMQGRRAGG